MLTRLLILSFVLTFSSCSDNRQNRKDIVADKIVLINENRTEWDNLTNEILNDTFVNQQSGQFISPDNLNEKLKIRLLEKGIVRISVRKQDNCKEVEYSTNWTEYPIGKLYLTWTTCDSVQTQKGFYLDNFNANFIEVWGVGTNWLIWVDSDFI